jgi:hypothetical protein
MISDSYKLNSRGNGSSPDGTCITTHLIYPRVDKMRGRVEFVGKTFSSISGASRRNWGSSPRMSWGATKRALAKKVMLQSIKKFWEVRDDSRKKV